MKCYLPSSPKSLLGLAAKILTVQPIQQDSSTLQARQCFEQRLHASARYGIPLANPIGGRVQLITRANTRAG